MPFKIFDKAISGYQKQIGLYDREQWECMIEERQLKNFRRIRRLPSKKIGSLVNLVDVDDVRATFHSQVQIQHSWYALTWKGFIRTLLFPFYLSWWKAQVAGLSWWLFVLYITQIVSTIAYIHYSDLVEQLSFSEALFPFVLMIVLGILQNHISCTDISHRVPGRRPYYRHSEHDHHDHGAVWHDDDVQLSQPLQQPSLFLGASQPLATLAMQPSDTNNRLNSNKNFGAGGTTVFSSLGSDVNSTSIKEGNTRLNGSPNRVEFAFAPEQYSSGKVCLLPPVPVNGGLTELSDPKIEACDSSADDDKPPTSRRGSVTGGDSRGESDNESDSDISRSLPLLSVNRQPRVAVVNGVEIEPQLPPPLLQYKNSTENASDDNFVCYSGDSAILANPELASDINPEHVVGTMLTPEQMSSLSSGNLLDKQSQPKYTNGDDSAFSETSGVVRCSQPVHDNLKYAAMKKSTPPPLIPVQRQPSSTSSSGEALSRPNANATEAFSPVDRVSEWRRTSSLSGGAATGGMSSGQLRRRKMSGKDKSVVQNSHDSDEVVPSVVDDQASSRSASLQPDAVGQHNNSEKLPGVVINGQANSFHCKPILRNRGPPRKSSFSEARTASPTSSIDSSKRSVSNNPNSGSTRMPNTRRRGAGTTTDDTEWDMHTEVMSESLSSSSEAEPEQCARKVTMNGSPPAIANQSSNTCTSTGPNPVAKTAVVNTNATQPSVIVETANTGVPSNTTSGQPINPSASTESVPFPGDICYANASYPSQASNKISCLFWDSEGCKKVEMALNDLGRILIDRVQRSVPPGSEYAYASACFAVVVAVVPLLLRFYQICQPVVVKAISCDEPIRALAESVISTNVTQVGAALFSSQRWEAFLILNGIWQRFWLSLVFFFLLCVAENTFKQRVSYAKHFSYLTSAHRARRCDLPHFRLNKVRNIKTWLTLRAYIKRLGPQRPVDIIVSFSFILSVMLLSLLTFLILRDSSTFMTDSIHWELAFWLFVLAIFLLRFMTLGTKINRKYRSLSVLITEQINLYLQMEEKPEKKESLLNANSALKLAEELIKELESPFKISGLAANPILYNISKVVLLSAFSAVATELLGFKLKLYKIKMP